MGTKHHEEALQNSILTPEQLFRRFGNPHVLDDLIRLRAVDATQQPILAYPNFENGHASYEYFTGRDLDAMIDQAAQILVNQGFTPQQNDSKYVVALLTPSDLNMIITLFALSRLGYSIMLLSTRLSAAACVSLLDAVGCDTILYEPSLNIRATIGEVLRLKAIACRSIVQRASLSQAQVSPSVSALKRSRSHEEQEKSVAIIMHSSGSTGFPKPIFITHQVLKMFMIRGSEMTAFIPLPWFHSYGLCKYLPTMYMGKTAFMWNTSLPLTAGGLVAAMEEAQPESVHIVPYILQLLADSSHGVELLRKCKVVTYGGAVCPDELGNRLVHEGVRLGCQFGSTESGTVADSTSRPKDDPYWNYLQFDNNLWQFIWMKPIGNSLYEAVYLTGLPSLRLTNSNDPPGSYHSRDVFEPHPTISGRWKYISRLDDRVTLINGEKVLPLPIEGTIKQHSLVQEAVVVGIGKAVPGLLVFRSEESKGLSDEEYFDSVWPAIQDANSRAEQFSQVAREMVAVLPHDAPCPRTDKGSIIRMQVYMKYAEVIDSMYARLETGEGGRFELDTTATGAHLMKLCQEVGLSIPGADVDLFSQGVDSLKAIHLRRLILRDFKIVDSGAISQNVVFETGTIARLAEHICSVQSGRQTRIEDEISLIRGLIKKYSSFHQHSPSLECATGKSVILTGATGSIGAHILVTLLDDDSISTLYCLTRRNKPKDAILNTLSQKDLQLPTSKTQKIIALHSTLEKPNLGIDEEILHKMQQSITLIIHTAWPVNFNLPLSTFEPHIKGLHNLIQFSLSVHQPTPAALFFCSSISTALGLSTPEVHEKPIPDLHSALEMGYGRSKFVGEHIVSNARKSGARAYTLRIGQVSGHSEKGLWNDSEAIPLMIRSAVTLKVLPELDVECSWLPVDVLARGIIEITGACECVSRPYSPRSDSSGGSSYSMVEDEDDTVYNLCNPYTFRWSSLLTTLREHGFEFKTVPFETWLQMLRDSEARGEELVNPAVKLTAHYEATYSGSPKPEQQGKRFLTGKAERDSVSLRDGRLRIIEDGVLGSSARDWLKRWRVNEEK
ncbi:putative NRPS-like protein biosynthetic cluster [Aspergillus chevalieri]|uniref:Putative NRPS-like protein biosynthetic cluster n=1 Tax=Aspergillus chevalieri TaxID=182096 RepID=A0A7R7VR83_ASPCH|nr:putative NRPS-like protein biosynthetic cluster [Aspergillus chevalieri]BCR89337.1 putative NRPS-like protein biosynthetic cluster [Aspergillus chevalieri]